MLAGKSLRPEVHEFCSSESDWLASACTSHKIQFNPIAKHKKLFVWAGISIETFGKKQPEELNSARECPWFFFPTLDSEGSDPRQNDN